ncbi:hypothetical protein BH24ACT4_BH24ACT4_03230 [soil metagenome]
MLAPQLWAALRRGPTRVGRQWEPIWSTTEGFHFLADGRSVVPSEGGSLLAVAVLWASDGIGPDEARFVRRGRATLVLQQHPGAPHGLRAVHTHFSLRPDPAA